MRLKIKYIEKKLGIKLRKNAVSLGLDTATKTGYCIARTNKVDIHFDIGYINLDMKEIKDKDLRNALRYEELYKRFKGLIKSEYIVVVENVYYKRNPQTLILLSRIGAIAWTIAKTKGCKIIIWKTASQARKMLGINQRCPKGKSKETITKRMNQKLKTNIKNDDIIDAIVLAIGGLIK